MAGIGTDFPLNFLRQRRIVAQNLLGVFPPLSELVAVIGEPRPGFFNDSRLDAQVNQFADFGNALAIHNIKINRLKRRRHFVLDNFDPRLAADNVIFVLNRPDPPDVHTNGRIKLQRVTARCRFRIAEHHADFHTDLVNKDNQRIGAGNRRRQLAQRLAHQPRLQPHMRVAHFAFQFRLRHQRRHRVDHHHVNRSGAHQRIGDFQRLFARIRLRNQEVVNIHADFLGIRRVKRVFGINKRTRPALFLRLRDNAQRQRRLARAFRPVYFHNSAFRQTADSERNVQPDGAGGNRLNINLGILPQPHNGAFAERSFNLAQRRF